MSLRLRKYNLKVFCLWTRTGIECAAVMDDFFVDDLMLFSVTVFTTGTPTPTGGYGIDRWELVNLLFLPLFFV